MLKLRRLTTENHNFWSQLETLLAWETVSDAQIRQTVHEILQQIQRQGDAALLEYTRQFDHRQVQTMSELIISPARLQHALNNLDPAPRQALEQAAARIRNYHQRQKQESWQYTEADGTVLGQQITPLVGVEALAGRR